MWNVTEAEAREVLGRSAGPVSAAPLTHNPKNGVTAGVWTVTAGDRTAVLKVLTRTKEATGRWAASDDPRHWNYWLREANVYDSGLARTWQSYGIRAPRLLASVERADGDVALWLEQVRGEPGTAWPLARHIEHARRLGAAQGATPAFDEPWLSRRFLRQYVGSNTRGEELLDDDEAWQQPLVRDHFPAGLRHDMVRLHHDREWFLEVMEALPRTFSHLDQWPANVRSDGPDSVLFDREERLAHRPHARPRERGTAVGLRRRTQRFRRTPVPGAGIDPGFPRRVGRRGACADPATGLRGGAEWPLGAPLVVPRCAVVLLRRRRGGAADRHSPAPLWGAAEPAPTPRASRPRAGRHSARACSPGPTGRPAGRVRVRKATSRSRRCGRCPPCGPP